MVAAYEMKSKCNLLVNSNLFKKLFSFLIRTEKKLTSVDEGVDVFNFSKGGMIAVRHQGLHRVQQAVHIHN
jgi:hypothetical protein